MKANVILITYNQEKDIAQALESILAQETSFEFDIIVADDCSTDKTPEIIRSYAEKSEVKFTFLQGTHNLGYIRNYQRAFSACTGDYIAIMEGDDYWNKSNHLQNHVDFLERFPESSMSFNRHVRLFVEQNREEIFDWPSDNDYEFITTEDLALGNRIGNLSCCMFRGRLIRDVDSLLFDMEIADWMLGMYMGQFGVLLYLKEVTSVYRIHNKGQWSQMDSRAADIKVIQLINEYDKYFNYKYTKPFRKHKRRLEIPLYGDNSFSRKIKDITPAFIKKIYRKL
jgi:glycosyltransferase involved in cell wall biosynthesis